MQELIDQYGPIMAARAVIYEGHPYTVYAHCDGARITLTLEGAVSGMRSLSPAARRGSLADLCAEARGFLDERLEGLTHEAVGAT